MSPWPLIYSIQSPSYGIKASKVKTQNGGPGLVATITPIQKSAKTSTGHSDVITRWNPKTNTTNRLGSTRSFVCCNNTRGTSCMTKVMDLNVFQIPPITNVTIERQRWQEPRITLPTIKEPYFTHLFHILPTLRIVSSRRNKFLKTGLNSPLWSSYDVTATPKSKTKYIKLTVLTRPFIWAIASRRTN